MQVVHMAAPGKEILHAVPHPVLGWGDNLDIEMTVVAAVAVVIVAVVLVIV